MIYEVESAIYFLKDVFYSEKEKIVELLKREINRDRMKFEKIYFELNMSPRFERLLSWFEERSQEI